MPTASEVAGGPIAAPALDGAVAWLNVASPIAMPLLRGKVVVLDFWTYGCVNCMHILRDLKTLAQRFPHELVVIGIHSPKFLNEKDTGLEGFIGAIRTVVRVFDERGEIDRTPLALDLERSRHADRPLLYPGKVLADQASGRLFIADSNHNRIVVASLDGELIETIGSGLQGDNDGIFQQARFYRPQGLALGPDHQLYVADTENHEIRVIDFPARAVHTVAGTGKQGAWSGDGGE